MRSVRRFAVFILLAGCAGMAEAQPASDWKIGILVSSTPALHASRDEALLQGLRALGYEEGKNVAIERRYAKVKPIACLYWRVSWSIKRQT